MKIKLILLAIFLFGAFLRFYNVTNVPPSLSHDEVAIGYNAWSILKSGKDEYGKNFPLLFRSFDDYKLPGMVYSTTFSESIFGLNEFSVRFPSAFYGTLAILVFYFLARNLFPTKKELALIPTFFFAFSIWHINFSRQLFESNGALFFLMLGTAFLLGFRKKPVFLCLAAFFYALSFYFYYSVRLVIPPLLLAFLIVYRKELLSNIKITIVALTIGIITIFPLLPSMFSPGGFERIDTVSVVNDPNFISREADYSKITAQNQNNIILKTLYNRRMAIVETIAENYFKNLSLDYIFFSGTGPLGLLYPIEMPFFFAGIYFLFRNKEKSKWIFITWFLSAPLAGAFTVNQPNPLRVLLGAPMFSLMSGIGFTQVISFIKSKKLMYSFACVAIVVFLFSFINFFKTYYINYPKENSLHFGDGYKQMVAFVQSKSFNYDKIYISGYYWRPYIFVLFWEKYDPKLYQTNGTRDGFGKYVFGRASWDREGIFFGDSSIGLTKLSDSKKSLFILSPMEYKAHQANLNQVVQINGKYAKNVFIAAVLK